MRRIISMLLTLFCAVIILGAGYFVIVESGKRVLEKEQVLEESNYENTSSNIFYGEIEEDIELFPWNLCPEEGEIEDQEDFPRFWDSVVNDAVGEEEEKQAQNWYLCQIIAFQADVDSGEVWEWYEKKGETIMDSLAVTNDSLWNTLYFYQDILELNGKQYEVRIAFSEWDILSFICSEQGGKEKEDKKQWEEGKKKLIEGLENSQEEMSEYVAFMTFLRSQSVISFFDMESGYINSYRESLCWLEDIITKKRKMSKRTKLLLKEEMAKMYGYWKEKETASYELEKSKDTESLKNENISGQGTEVNVEPSYSYQIIELKNMILLLMQGEYTFGIYYEPVSQRFCGYNYFYE
ncbi:MAG: hypothetical protein HFH48_07080 [Lachnospiraceae bacterium]|nr:hypothetical protein [Lachnospiraceae bacterium]